MAKKKEDPLEGIDTIAFDTKTENIDAVSGKERFDITDYKEESPHKIKADVDEVHYLKESDFKDEPIETIQFEYKQPIETIQYPRESLGAKAVRGVEENVGNILGRGAEEVRKKYTPTKEDKAKEQSKFDAVITGLKNKKSELDQRLELEKVKANISAQQKAIREAQGTPVDERVANRMISMFAPKTAAKSGKGGSGGYSASQANAYRIAQLQYKKEQLRQQGRLAMGRTTQQDQRYNYVEQAPARRSQTVGAMWENRRPIAVPPEEKYGPARFGFGQGGAQAIKSKIFVPQEVRDTTMMRLGRSGEGMTGFIRGSGGMRGGLANFGKGSGRVDVLGNLSRFGKRRGL